MELVHCHIAKQPPAPHTINPDIPRGEGQPELRYQSPRSTADLLICQQQLQPKVKFAAIPAIIRVKS